jgi:hypothetical protein
MGEAAARRCRRIDGLPIGIADRALLHLQPVSLRTGHEIRVSLGYSDRRTPIGSFLRDIRSGAATDQG